MNLINEAKKFGLLNYKNKNIDVNINEYIITELALLPLYYKGDVGIILNKVNEMSANYPIYYNYLHNYFLENKLKYFQDNSLNYYLCLKDVRSNSILERYNRHIKTVLNKKRYCNWILFLNFINDELIAVYKKLSKNTNLNVQYEKKTKFGLIKYGGDDKNSNKKKIISNDSINYVYQIFQKWLYNKVLLCRYNAFITLFYFTIFPYLFNNKEYINSKLEIISNLIKYNFHYSNKNLKL